MSPLSVCVCVSECVSVCTSVTDPNDIKGGDFTAGADGNSWLKVHLLSFS